MKNPESPNASGPKVSNEGLWPVFAHVILVRHTGPGMGSRLPWRSPQSTEWIKVSDMCQGVGQMQPGVQGALRKALYYCGVGKGFGIRENAAPLHVRHGVREGSQ